MPPPDKGMTFGPIAPFTVKEYIDRSSVWLYPTSCAPTDGSLQAQIGMEIRISGEISFNDRISFGTAAPARALWVLAAYRDREVCSAGALGDGMGCFRLHPA